jgi:hypothetical protein
MEPISIAVICTVVFGVVTALSVFVRQLLLSRDKRLNDKAQHRALAQEAKELEKLRTQMASNKRFNSHYQVLGDNKDAIQYIDQKIEDILAKKLALIQRYGQMTIKESSAMIDGAQSGDRKVVCDLLKEEIDREIKLYDTELQQLQSRRASLWGAHHDLQDYLIAQEMTRNENLDKLYQGHSGLLEKIYVHHNESAERVTKLVINAGTHSLKYMALAPLQMLMEYFKPSKNISPEKMQKEKLARQSVSDIEDSINGKSDSQSVSNLADEQERELSSLPTA